MKPASLVTSNVFKNLLVILPLMLTSFACKPKDEGKWVTKITTEKSVAALPVGLTSSTIESLEDADSAPSNAQATGDRLENLKRACDFRVAKGTYNVFTNLPADKTFYDTQLVQPYALGKYNVLEKLRSGDSLSTSSDSYSLSVSYVIDSPELKLEDRERLLIQLNVEVYESKMSVQQVCTIEYKTH